LVLDGVDKLEQLKVLAGEYDWFGSGNIIIITTRDKHLLATHGVVKLYDFKPLNVEKVLQLFNWHALIQVMRIFQTMHFLMHVAFIWLWK